MNINMTCSKVYPLLLHAMFDDNWYELGPPSAPLDPSLAATVLSSSASVLCSPLRRPIRCREELLLHPVEGVEPTLRNRHHESGETAYRKRGCVTCWKGGVCERRTCVRYFVSRSPGARLAAASPRAFAPRIARRVHAQNGGASRARA